MVKIELLALGIGAVKLSCLIMISGHLCSGVHWYQCLSRLICYNYNNIVNTGTTGGVGISTYKENSMIRRRSLEHPSGNLPGLIFHGKIFHGNFNKQTAKAMLELTRNKLRIL